MSLATYPFFFLFCGRRSLGIRHSGFSRKKTTTLCVSAFWHHRISGIATVLPIFAPVEFSNTPECRLSTDSNRRILVRIYYLLAVGRRIRRRILARIVLHPWRRRKSRLRWDWVSRLSFASFCRSRMKLWGFRNLQAVQRATAGENRSTCILGVAAWHHICLSA